MRHFICVYSTFTTLRGIYLYYPIFYSSGNEGTERLNSNLNAGNQVSEPMLLTTTQSDATWIRQAAVCHAEETTCTSSKAMRWEWAWHLQGIKDEAGQGAEKEGSEVHSMKHWMPREVLSNGVIWSDVCFWKITLTAAQRTDCRGNCLPQSAAWLSSLVCSAWPPRDNCSNAVSGKL